MGKLSHPLRLLPGLAIFWQLVACASVTPTYNARAYVDPSDAKHKQWVNDAYDVEAEATADMEVWEKGEVPAGITLLEEGRDIEIARAFKGQYEAIGYISLDLKSARKWASTRGWFWTWKYEQKWRRYLCWPQIPLRYLTFFAWRLMPTNYLCEASLPGSDEDSRELLTRRAKAIAKAMGGNTLVITNELSRVYYFNENERDDRDRRWPRSTVKKLDVLMGAVIRDKTLDSPPTSVGDSAAESAGKGPSGQEGS